MPSSGFRLFLVLGLLGAGLVAGAGRSIYATDAGPTVTEFPLASGSAPGYIVLGPDSNLWFSEANGDRIGRLTPAGQLTEFPLPTRGAHPERIIVGPDRNLWFIEAGRSQVGRITPAGAITEFPLGPSYLPPQSMIAGPDGAVWVGEEGYLWRVTPDGAVTRGTLDRGDYIDAMTVDRSGTIWLAGHALMGYPLSEIGRFAPNGKTTWTFLGDLNATVGVLSAAADGALWFTMPDQRRVGRLVPGSTIEFFPLGIDRPKDLFGATDGTFWVSTDGDDALRQLTATGQIRSLPVPGSGWRFVGLAQTRDGAIWFPEPDKDRIGRLAPSPFPANSPRSMGPLLFLASHTSVSGAFRAYWEQHGGLALQGYPLTEEFTEVSALDGKPYTVQYFERAVFEHHPENQPPYDVLLSQLGTYRYQQLYPQAAPGQQRNPNNARYFSQTGHALGGSFRAYWEQHGGLAQFGYPLSDEFPERSALDGQTYTVQYFERAVFEWHPENRPPYDVLLSQLGTFRLHEFYPQGPPGP